MSAFTDILNDRFTIARRFNHVARIVSTTKTMDSIIHHWADEAMLDRFMSYLSDTGCYRRFQRSKPVSTSG